MPRSAAGRVRVSSLVIHYQSSPGGPPREKRVDGFHSSITPRRDDGGVIAEGADCAPSARRPAVVVVWLGLQQRGVDGEAGGETVDVDVDGRQLSSGNPSGRSDRVKKTKRPLHGQVHDELYCMGKDALPSQGKWLLLCRYRRGLKLCTAKRKRVSWVVGGLGAGQKVPGNKHRRPKIHRSCHPRNRFHSDLPALGPKYAASQGQGQGTGPRQGICIHTGGTLELLHHHAPPKNNPALFTNQVPYSKAMAACRSDLCIFLCHKSIPSSIPTSPGNPSGR
jgi:hypothetical protein